MRSSGGKAGHREYQRRQGTGKELSGNQNWPQKHCNWEPNQDRAGRERKKCYTNYSEREKASKAGNLRAWGRGDRIGSGGETTRLHAAKICSQDEKFAKKRQRGCPRAIRANPTQHTLDFRTGNLEKTCARRQKKKKDMGNVHEGRTAARFKRKGRSGGGGAGVGGSASFVKGGSDLVPRRSRHPCRGCGHSGSRRKAFVMRRSRQKGGIPWGSSRKAM